MIRTSLMRRGGRGVNWRQAVNFSHVSSSDCVYHHTNLSFDQLRTSQFSIDDSIQLHHIHHFRCGWPVWHTSKYISPAQVGRARLKVKIYLHIFIVSMNPPLSAVIWWSSDSFLPKFNRFPKGSGFPAVLESKNDEVSLCPDKWLKDTFSFPV